MEAFKEMIELEELIYSLRKAFPEDAPEEETVMLGLDDLCRKVRITPRDDEAEWAE